MKKVLLFCFVLLNLILAGGNVQLTEKWIAAHDSDISTGLGATADELVSFSDDQLLEAIPNKTPRTITISRRRSSNASVEFFTCVQLSSLTFCPSIGQKVKELSQAVFKSLGGEIAFLFRLTPF